MQPIHSDKKCLLKALDISKAFSGVEVLKNINFSLLAGEVHALLGGNGAGKSTLMKIIAGILPADRGELEIQGKLQRNLSVAKAHQLGVYLVPQEPLLFPNLTVQENIFFGLKQNKKTFQYATALLAELNPHLKLNMVTALLDVADQQLVEIMRALVRNASILILDEPTASLSPAETTQLFTKINALTEKGVGIIFISHKLNEVWQIAHRVTVMRDGCIVLNDDIKRINQKDVIDAITPQINPPKLTEKQKLWLELHNYPSQKNANKAVLQITNLSGEGFKNISFDLYAGEILGLAGVVGSGRTELAETLFGLRQAQTGEIIFKDNQINQVSLKQRLNLGIVYLPEDRQTSGLFLDSPLALNICSLTSHQDLWLNFSKEQAILERYRRVMNIKFSHSQQAVRTLSGGNQQKILIAKCLETHPCLLIVDEPTRGVDVGARAEIYQLIKAIAKQNIAILFISSDLEEIQQMADRVLVMHDGQIGGLLCADQINSENIMQIAFGNSIK